jgi:large subunit ribosomal protein L47
MKWDRWKYKPNMEAIANIGKGPSPLDAFRDMVPKEKREAEPVGRSWSVRELRRKSYEDLHKLWYVLYKERNMLLTESNLSRRHGYTMIQPNRRQKVRKSMGAIKHVLGERKRAKIADHRAYLAELERFNGLMAELKLEEGGDKEENELEEAMHKESNEMKLDKVE